jgi:hypothetical protein
VDLNPDPLPPLLSLTLQTPVWHFTVNVTTKDPVTPYVMELTNKKK